MLRFHLSVLRLFRGIKLPSRVTAIKVHTIANRSVGTRCASRYLNVSAGSNGDSFQYDEDYHLFLSGTERKLKQLLDSPTRYQPIEKREDRSDIPPSVAETICLGKYITNYRGSLLLREPKELAVFRHFLAYTRPRTIIELGTFTGSSAIWFADTAALLGLDCHVYSTDVDHSLVSEEIKSVKSEKVTLIQGNRNKLEDVFSSRLLQKLPHPWLVLEDNPVDLFVGFKYLNDFMSVGDYLVVENSDPHLSLRPGLHLLYDKEEMVPAGNGNLELLRKCLQEYGQDYQVDSFYTDLYGYNCIPHWHGFLCKMQNDSYPANRHSTSFSTLNDNGTVSDDRCLLVRKSREKLQQLLKSPTRYQSIDDREDCSDVPQKLIQCESVGRYLGRYRGAVILKTTYDLVVYYQLLSYLKPNTIIELGTFTGASALWCADSITSLGLDAQIYTVDIDPTLVSEETKQKVPDNVTLIEGDFNKIAEVFPPSMLQSFPHPWLVIDDGHYNFETVMAYLNDYMITGDYLVVEDTDPRIPAKLGIYNMEKEIQTWGTEKLDTLKKFVRGTGKQFMVDTFFTDYYGYNSSWHWHGFLQKCSNN